MTTYPKWPGVLAGFAVEQRRKRHPTPSDLSRWIAFAKGMDHDIELPPTPTFEVTRGGTVEQIIARGRERRARVVAAVRSLGKPSYGRGGVVWSDIARAAGVPAANVGALWREAVKRGEVEE